MKVKEIMEKAAMTRSGRAISYIKDALDEMAIEAPTHIATIRFDLIKDQRFYLPPNEAIKILDVRAKNHDNDNDKYRSIPRTVFEPATEDTDGI